MFSNLQIAINPHNTETHNRQNLFTVLRNVYDRDVDTPLPRQLISFLQFGSRYVII